MTEQHEINEVKFSEDQLVIMKDIFGDTFESDIDTIKFIVFRYNFDIQNPGLGNKEIIRRFKSLERKGRMIIKEVSDFPDFAHYFEPFEADNTLDELDAFCQRLAYRIERTNPTPGRPMSPTWFMLHRISKVLEKKNLPFNSRATGPARKLLTIVLDVCNSKIADHKQLIDYHLQTN